MMKRLIFPIALLVVVVVYFGASAVLYTRLATVAPLCGGNYVGNTPAQFTTAPFNAALDTTPYWMPTYETVRIPSRDADIILSGWFVPSAQPDAPAVLITHGLGAGASDCKRNPRALLAAGMLYRAGYTVLLIDVREHGDSTIENGRWGGGGEEARDILGAWDWLVDVQQIAPERIGLFGYSGGSAATMIAFGEEPRIAAAWLDSVYADLNVAINDVLVKSGFPTIMAYGGLLIGRLGGDDMTAYNPITEVSKFGERPVFITHSIGDPALSVEYARTLTAAIEASGGTVEYWETEGALHAQSMFISPDEYARRLVQFFDSAL
ncbi:MAG: prolyl oligopeptidase family serine peptidase [Anaerolineae bacterium]|nr:prolyl oligopeptidase family serine peptidase [Anaerolineae bacterium]